jgi:hypothetical protein
MPVEIFTDGLEPQNRKAPIWRFMEFWKFCNLMRTGELYFCRADLFEDESEGLPPEHYIPLRVPRPVDAEDVDDIIGSAAQFREAYYITCWYLTGDEPPLAAEMWKKYDVAVCSRYDLLHSALDALDPSAGRPHLGLVRYGSNHLTGWNEQRFITTKQEQYQHEKELRAALWCPEQTTFTGVNRHYDANNKPHRRPLTPSRAPAGLRRAVDLPALITGVVAPDPVRAEVEWVTRQSGHSISVRSP